MSEQEARSAARGHRNLLVAPITDPLYADSLALRTHMESYDYIVSQPIVLGPEASKRWRDIVTLERTMEASAGDWIIRGIQGEFYPCKPYIFEETYEPAD